MSIFLPTTNQHVRPIEACTHVSDLEILPHQEVKGGAGVSPDGPDAAAAAPQEPQTKVGALLRLLLKQQLRKLQRQSRVYVKHFQQTVAICR